MGMLTKSLNSEGFLAVVPHGTNLISFDFVLELHDIYRNDRKKCFGMTKWDGFQYITQRLFHRVLA